MHKFMRDEIQKLSPRDGPVVSHDTTEPRPGTQVRRRGQEAEIAQDFDFHFPPKTRSQAGQGVREHVLLIAHGTALP